MGDEAVRRQMRECRSDCAATPVRVLSPEEVEELMQAGRITQIEQIPENHAMARVSHPRGFLEFVR